MSDVAVIVVSRNMSSLLKRCLESLLVQTVADFRLIVVDDASSDDTEKMLGYINDSRIDYAINDNRRGIAASRNRGINLLKNEKFIFFIDADCCAEPAWLENGVNVLRDKEEAVAVEGKTAYVSEYHKPGFSEKCYHTDSSPGLCQTCNVMYRKEVLEKIYGFDEKLFNYMNEDTDFFYRAKAVFPHRDFLYHPDMKVTHQKVTWNIADFFL